jgi:hypothetical protein
MYMDTARSQITTILSEAENQLRRVIGEAAARGDYSGVDVARHIAVEVQEIRERLNIVVPAASSTTKMDRASTKNESEDKGRRSKGVGYPKFMVEKDTLTKVGWSKKEKKEYTHRVSRAVFEQTLQTMMSLSNGKAGPFTADQIIEKMNKSGVDFTPSYQVYIVIAFLRKAHCIRQEGRDGYSILPELATKGNKAWDEACKVS